MPINFNARRAPQTVSVSTTVLRINGQSLWTGTDADEDQDRSMILTNNGTTNNVHVKVLPKGDSLPSQATVEAQYDLRIAPGETRELFVGAGTVAYIVRAASSNNVTARVFVW